MGRNEVEIFIIAILGIKKIFCNFSGEEFFCILGEGKEILVHERLGEMYIFEEEEGEPLKFDVKFRNF